MARAVGFTGVIVLDVHVAGGLGFATCVFWMTAPTNRIVPIPTFKSAVPSTAPFSLTAGETTALQNGTVVEQVRTFDGCIDLPTLQTAIQNAFNATQTALTNSAFAASKLPGAFWDKTTWTLPP
jgi:hypothetical protein